MSIHTYFVQFDYNIHSIHEAGWPSDVRWTYQYRICTSNIMIFCSTWPLAITPIRRMWNRLIKDKWVYSCGKLTCHVPLKSLFKSSAVNLHFIVFYVVYASVGFQANTIIYTRYPHLGIYRANRFSFVNIYVRLLNFYSIRYYALKSTSDHICNKT